MEFFFYFTIYALLLVTAVVIYAYILIFVFPKYRKYLRSSWKETVEFWSITEAKKFVKEFIEGKKGN
jgi:hypothetical protein